jgi:sodium-dependent phosphate cotransporter
LDAPVPDPSEIVHVEGRELPSEDILITPARTRPLPLRLAYLVIGLGLFVTALGLMKAGAAELVPSLEGSIFTDNAASTLGLGWLGACIVLSGSPVAASALTLLEGGAIDRTQSFTMLVGSRLGASFVVLVVGSIYAIRNRHQTGRRGPVSIGVLSLLTTWVVYVPAGIIGLLLLRGGTFDGFDIGTSPGLTSATDAAFGWAVDLMKDIAPDWALFPAGLGLLLVGFNVFDKVMPEVGSDQLDHRSDSWYTRKWPMFLVGCGITMLTLSVAVSLSVLVPLVAKKHLRRANVLPYIAGANITTLVDTLVAAIVVGDQDAVRVVAAIFVSVTAWTLLLLAVGYPLLRRAILASANAILGSQARLTGFVAVLLLVPVALIIA